MPNHFSSIGFNFQSPDHFQEIIMRVVNLAKHVPVDRGHYLRWSSPSGAELWLQANEDRQVTAMHPHFAGSSRVRIGITESLQREGDAPLDGAFYAWANPKDGKPTEGDYPFVFDVPNYMTHFPLSLPRIATAQISAFAYELRAYESAEAYDAEDAPEPKFASRSFIPTGLFPVPDGNDLQPRATAMFTGHVLQCERRVNELTGLTFYWLSLDTLGGIFDVVADPELVAELPPVGAIVQGQFWLSGYPIDLPLKRSGYQKVWDFIAGKNTVD